MGMGTLTVVICFINAVMITDMDTGMGTGMITAMTMIISIITRKGKRNIQKWFRLRTA